MATRFSKPLDFKGDGYDEKQGSLWRVRVPLGTARKVILDDGIGLSVKSNNSQVIPNGKLDEVTVNGGKMRVFSLFANAEGVSMIEAKDGAGLTKAFIQVATVDDTAEVQTTDPSKQAEYIDQRLVAVGYSIYLGGCHLYCDNLKLPVFLPNADINFMLASAQSVGETVFADRAAATKAALSASRPGTPAPIAYYRGVGGALIVPTVFSPASTPRTIQTLRTAMVVLANDVKNDMTVLAGTLVGAQVLKMLATRVIRWSQGKPETIAAPAPKPQLHPAEERLLKTQDNLQGDQVVRSGRMLTAPERYRHDLSLNYRASYGAIEKGGTMRLSTDVNAHFGEGVYAWEANYVSKGPYIDIEIPAGNAVERIQFPSGKVYIRIVPPQGMNLPVKIVGTNLTAEEVQFGRIMAR